MPSLGEIEEQETNCGTSKDGDHRCLEAGRMDGPADPGSLGFNVQLFELHICIYIDINICKSNLFCLYFHFIPTFLYLCM